MHKGHTPGIYWPMKSKKTQYIAYAVVAGFVILTWLCFWFLKFEQSFPDRFTALGVLFGGLGIVGLLFTMVQDSRSRSDMADAILRLDAQNKLQLEILYLQCITAEMNGMKLLAEHFPNDYPLAGLKTIVGKCRSEIYFSRERARELLGIKPRDL